MPDHYRVAQAVGDVCKANGRATVAVVPDATMVRSAAPAKGRSRTVGPCHRCRRRFAASPGAVIAPGGADGISDGVAENEAVAETAEIATGPGPRHLRRDRSADGACGADR